MSNYADPDGKVREDFPGGWESDQNQLFLGENLEGDQEKAYSFMQKLGEYRSKNPGIFTGDLIHFVPENNTYTYFRDGELKRIMITMNFNSEAKVLKLDRFSELCSGHKKAMNVITDELLILEDELSLPPWSITILELQPE